MVQASIGCVAASPDLIAAIRANPENYYVNVHTPEFPEGAVRGQLGLMIVALTTANTMFEVGSDDPATPLFPERPITGLQPGEQILAIDFRTTVEELHGLGSSGRLYRIEFSGAATPVAGPAFGVTPGEAFGWDFNPVVDAIRAVGDGGTNRNLRLDPDTGLLLATDTAVAYAATDPNAGADPNVVGSAYTNNFIGAAATTLYGIDSGLDVLVTQNPPNTGTLTTVGALGVDAPADNLGFDVSTSAGRALAAWGNTLYTINLATGAATAVGPITASAAIRGIAVVP
jgi:hypothetical protein